jgi:hypothetical protein
MEVTLLDSYGEKEWPLKSYIGPDGKEWQFYEEDVLFAEPEEEVYYDDDFYFGTYGATPFEYNHDKSELYAFLETYDRNYEIFFYYDSSGATCQFVTEFDEDGNIMGWEIRDPFQEFHCPYIRDGWTYSYVTVDEVDGTPIAFTGP